MSYLGEIRLNWTQLLSAATGLALGSALSHYTMSMFGPPILAEFGWTKSQFALIGSLPLISMLFVPVAGRFTDRFGTKVAAIVGFSGVPLGFVGFALMDGSIWQFLAIYIFQHILGILTTSLVFCRMIVERFDAARGIALSIIMTGPPLAGAILAPALGSIIQSEGWRIAFLLLAALSALGGIAAIMLMGRNRKKALAQKTELPTLTLAEFFGLIRQRTYLLIVAGMFLVNIPQVIAASQLKLVLLDSQVSDNAATWMVSLYATGVIVGRFFCGLALDRMPAHIVALAALGLPAIGLLTISSAITLPLILGMAVLLIGLAQGAEGDVGAYIISRQFDVKNYSLLLSGVTAMIMGGSAVGSLILSFTLSLTGSYSTFLVISAIATVVGALLFAFTGAGTRSPTVSGEMPSSRAAAL